MTKHIALPPIEQLNELLEIVPIAESQFKIQSGLIWKVGRQGTKGIGSVAGSKKPNPKTPGRFDWRVQVDGRFYYVSRVIYFMANGVDPGELTVDHEDQNPMNNNVGNLRLGDGSLQEHNKGLDSNNKSGAKNVTWHKNAKKWMARLSYKGEDFHLGYHTCKIEAARVVNAKILELGLDKIGKPLIDLESLECSCSSCQNSPA
jgi:hypothetical protein